MRVTLTTPVELTGDPQPDPDPLADVESGPQLLPDPLNLLLLDSQAGVISDTLLLPDTLADSNPDPLVGVISDVLRPWQMS